MHNELIRYRSRIRTGNSDTDRRPVLLEVEGPCAKAVKGGRGAHLDHQDHQENRDGNTGAAAATAYTRTPVVQSG